MGGCSGTYVFDGLCEIILDKNITDKKELLKNIVEVLQDNDGDCESDSKYGDYPIVQEVMKELKPHGFEEE